MEIKARKTFKDVHAELENEHIFLLKNHDLKGFNDKAKFLKTIGLTNSIATKIYSGIIENRNVFNDYQTKYGIISKFIIEPQLERICEKYDLYVRSLRFFLGDIPEKNIKDLMNFKIDLYDIYEKDRNNAISEYIHKNSVFNPYNGIDLMNKSPIFVTLDELANIVNISNYLEIAAVKILFSIDAFTQSFDRIVNKKELEAKSIVEMDPIILFKTNHGRLIITAWGDEANDELVANQNTN